MIRFIILLLSVSFRITVSERCACLYWSGKPEPNCLQIEFFEKLLQSDLSITKLNLTLIKFTEKDDCSNITEEDRKWGFSGSIDVTTNTDGTHSYGGSIDTPFGGISAHVHTSPDHHVIGGDGGFSVGTGVVSGGLHGSYDKGSGGSVGGHVSAGIPGISGGLSVDIDSHGTVTGGASGTVGGTSMGGSINSKGETSGSISSSTPFGKKRQNQDEEPLVESSFVDVDLVDFDLNVEYNGIR